MSWIAPPQQFYGWNGQTAPAGWPGTWPPAAPSGPPPVPRGVDPRTWLGGQWQPNPMFRPNPAVQNPAIVAPAWAPHPSWGAAAANFNPYKRVPNPGNAEYWATEITNNTLGMENMIPYVRPSQPEYVRCSHRCMYGVGERSWKPRRSVKQRNTRRQCRNRLRLS